jgi:hypothetical protein
VKCESGGAIESRSKNAPAAASSSVTVVTGDSAILESGRGRASYARTKLIDAATAAGPVTGDGAVNDRHVSGGTKNGCVIDTSAT